MESEFLVTTFYRFVSLSPVRLTEIQGLLCEQAEEESVCGLIILGSEGVNATLAARAPDMERYKDFLVGIPEFSELLFKDSRSFFQPFRRFKIKVRDEIVTLKREDLRPESDENNHLSPAEWERELRNEDVVVIDTRNRYETRIGKFVGALDPEIGTFSEFKDFVKEAQLPRQQKILMYCTGGIRCEKAILEMQEMGYENVYQLQGGILHYLEEYPHSQFEGECFVFDHRVAVNQELKPSEDYRLCPHCGDPGRERICCGNCGKEGVICESCQVIAQRQSCSKNCAYHLGVSLGR